MDEHPGLLTIGQLATRTGLPVRTLRFWSDEGVLPPAGRSAAGYRLYDAAGVARAELARTLRELGLPLDQVSEVLDGRATIAEVAATHVAALDARIRSLKVSRAVLSTVAHRGSTAEETALMNQLARLSTAERERIIDDFKASVFGPLDLDPEHRDRLRDMRIDLPEDPSPDQVDAWIELATLLQDKQFQERLGAFFALNTPAPGGPKPPGARIWWARQVIDAVAEARAGGVRPGSAAAADLIATLFRPGELPEVRRSLEAGLAARAERYRHLTARVRGRRGAPEATEELIWLSEALG